MPDRGNVSAAISTDCYYKFAGLTLVCSDPGRWWNRRSTKFRRDAKEVLHETRVLTLLLTHSSAPLRARAVAGCAALYLVSPIQLIPSFIPIIGQLDDLFVLWAGMKLARKFTSREILEECEAHALCGRFFSRRSEKPNFVQPSPALPLQPDP